jgi:hypothetical protein
MAQGILPKDFFGQNLELFILVNMADEEDDTPLVYADAVDWV